MSATTTHLHVNGVAHAVVADAQTPLLYVLRNDLGLKGTKFGCGLGQCGACTVLLDGRRTTACDTPLWAAEGKPLTTVEGLGTLANPGPLQRAFIAEQALQCGYCTAGMLMAAAALLAREPDPDEATIREALSHNLCRCGAHTRILRAVRRAALEMRS